MDFQYSVRVCGTPASYGYSCLIEKSSDMISVGFQFLGTSLVPSGLGTCIDWTALFAERRLKTQTLLWFP